MPYKKKTIRHAGKWQGMNWIRQEKRLAIYLRDGLACVYCGSTIEGMIIFTLDHLKPHNKGGSNLETNLVTCCEHCNKSRHDRGLMQWIKSVAGYVNGKTTAKAIMQHILNCVRRPLPMDEAREMIARRGSALAAINHMPR